MYYCFRKTETILSPFLTKTLIQENIFFDTPNSTLASNNAALRLRFYNLDSYSILSLKSNPNSPKALAKSKNTKSPSTHHSLALS
ncbi:hypothetical protein CRYUN_Cryun37aG0027500 [Craigia yunnanensis]